MLYRLIGDSAHHHREQVVALALVLNERIFLRHRAQPDALFEVVHLVEVLAPALVEHAHDHPALKFPHDLRAELLLAAVIGFLGIIGEFADEEVLGKTRAAPTGTLLQIGNGQRHRIDRAQFGEQAGNVPVLGVALGRRDGHPGRHHLVDEPPHLVGEVLAVQNGLAFGVDHLALPVHHFVVLEDVLADLGVLRFHLRLGTCDGPGDHLRLDRYVVGNVETGEEGVHHGGVETLHEVVREGQVEPRLTRVALTSRAPTQLVVDASGLVPLGAQHVEPTKIHNLVMLGGHGFFCLGQRVGPCGFVALGIFAG